MRLRLKPVSVVGWGLGLLAVGAAWASLAPASLLGGTTYVSTYGNSMLPYLHGGDLVAVRPADSYQAGDVVAYRNGILGGQIILHRVVGFEGTRLLMKGDNNPWIDEYQPSPGDIVGKEWFHVGGLGAQIGQIRSSQNAAIIFGVAGLFSVGVPASISNWLMGRSKRQKRFDRRNGKQGRSKLPRLAPPGLVASSGVLLAAAMVGVIAMLAVFAFAQHQPASRARVVGIPYAEAGTYSWSAIAPAGSVYPDGQLGTGDPVFVKLVNRVHVSFSYALTAADPVLVYGHASLDATVESALTGWKRTVVLERENVFVGSKSTLSGDLDPGQMLYLADAYAQAVGMRSDVLLLIVTAHVMVKGTVAGVPIEHEIAPELPFHLDETVLRLATERQAVYGATGSWTPVVAAQTGSGAATPQQQAAALLGPALDRQVLRVIAEPNRINALGLSPYVADVVRWSFDLSVLFAIAAVLFLLLLVLGLRTRDEPSLIQRRYGSQLVPVGKIAAIRVESAVQVTSMASLVRLAEHYDRMILHEQQDGEHWYAVQDGDLFYFYRTAGGPAEPPRGSVQGEAPKSGSVRQ